jgi:PAS domain S-box-containing protein
MAGLPPFITMMPAVVLAGVLCGTGPAAVASAAGLIAGTYLWVPPKYAFLPLSAPDAAGIVLFALFASLVLSVTHALRRALAQAAATRTVLVSERDRRQVYFDTAGTLLLVLDERGIVREINRHGLNLLGYEDAVDVQGRDWIEEFLVVSDRDEARRRLAAIGVGRGLARSESQVLCRDGSRRLISWQYTAARLSGGGTEIIASGQDVTEQRRIEADLRSSEARLRAILHQIPAAVAVLEAPVGTVTLRSDRSPEILGHPVGVASMADLGTYGGIHADGRRYAPEEYPISRALLHGETTEAELIDYLRPDGTKTSLEVYASPVRTPEGAIVASVGMAFDVSARRQAEDRLRESEQRFRTLAEAMPGMLFMVGADRRVDYVNQRLQAFVGIEPLGAIDELHLNVLHPEDRQRVAETWAAAIADEVPYEAEYRLRRHDGTYRWVLCRALPLSDTNGRSDRWLGIAVDIEERRQMEAALLRSESRLRMALETGGLGTWEADLATGRYRWDARLSEMFGLPKTPKTLDRAEARTFVHEDDRARLAADVDTAVATGNAYHCEFRIITANGELRWFASHGIYLRDEMLLFGVTRDVTLRRNREDTLRETLALRELLFREADHRIKNSLQLVMSMLELQRQASGDATVADAIGAATARVAAVAEAHLALQQNADFRTIDFGELLCRLCQGLAKLNPAIQLSCTVDDAMLMEADRAIHIALILNELVTNAQRHAFPNGLEGTISVRVARSSQQVSISVSDDGVGIAKEQSRQGLGTKVVRSLAAILRATIEVESRAGHGTRVSIALDETMHFG